MRHEAKFLSAARAILFTLALLTGHAPAASAKDTSAEQAKKASARAANSSKVLQTATGDRGIPKELLEKAQAVGVFPHLVKTKLLFEHLTISYGVVSARLPTGWSFPAYYAFGGAGFEFNVPGGETADVVMLFMNAEAVGWFQKGRFELNDRRKAVKGEVGPLTDEQRARLAQANIILYTVVGGEVSGKDYDSNFFNSFGLNPDNKLNKAVYGIKSSETLAGKPNKTGTLPREVTDFRDALSKLPNVNAGS